MKVEQLTKAQRWEIAEHLKEERLDHVNSICKPVVFRETFYTRYGKRMLDILLVLPMCLLTIPVNLLLAVVTIFDVGFPLMFVQERIGKNGVNFKLIKFRNMRIAYDKNGEMLPQNQRVSPIGKFVRKTSLDELLNFWMILKGDMSIIGPRPLVPEYRDRMSCRHKCRELVRPGLECPPRDRNSSNRTWQEQFENDVWYVENISFRTDCKLLFYLFCFTFNLKEADRRAEVERGAFEGYDLQGNALDMNDIPEDYYADICKNM